MHDRRRIRELHAGDGTIRGIARDVGASRNAVRRALDPDASLDYRRPTIADEHREAVRDVLADYPRISVMQVAEIVEWPASRRSLSALVAELRPAALERERDELTRPRVGRIAVGAIRVGPIRVGVLDLGRPA